MITPARLFDGKTARAQDVTLKLGGSVLKLTGETDALLGEWPLHHLRDENAAPNRNGIRLSVAPDDPARIEIDDAGFVEELRRLCPHLRKKRPAEAGWWKPYLYWGGGAVLSVVIIFTVVLPLLATQIAYLIPEKSRAEVGLQAERVFIKAIAKRQNVSPAAAVCRNEAGEQALQTLVATLGAGAGGDTPVKDVTVIRTPSANAFALPGGHLLVFSGLIDLADDPNSLAGVLAHEIGHAEFLHPTRLFVANAGIATVFSLLLGDVTGGAFLATMGQLTVGSAYTRDFERDADRAGVRLMQAANFDISPMIPMMKKLAAKANSSKSKSSGSGFSFFQSHPGLAERLALLDAAGSSGGLAMTAEGWAALKSICK
ncbi:M48 family metallopeptidase [Sneathiella sp.]|uniref:M48 family metallopeptidase n=1 Tax=Sneathiella sp. TaxID=1964365 RepID=UPI003567712B